MLAEPLRRFTPTTITSSGQLRSTLAEIRRVGHIHTPGHIRDAAAGVAVPVRGSGQRVVAALSVVVPNDELAIRTVPALHAAAHGIHRAMS